MFNQPLFTPNLKMISTSSRIISKRAFSTGRKASFYALSGVINVQRVNTTHRVENDSQIVNLYSDRKHYATSSKKVQPKVAVKPKKKTTAKTAKSLSTRTKAVAKKSKKLVKKPVKKTRVVAKKELSEEEKLKLKLKKLRLLVLTPPSPLPRTARSIFLGQNLSGKGSNVKDLLGKLSADWTALSKEEQDV